MRSSHPRVPSTSTRYRSTSATVTRLRSPTRSTASRPRITALRTDGGAGEDLQDIEAHLKGGIPDRDIDDLVRYWQVLPGLRSELFAPTGRAGYSQPLAAAAAVKAAIFGHAEFAAFTRPVDGLFAAWRRDNAPLLRGVARGDHPKRLIDALSERLLETFRAAPLLDPYDVYQRLMDYWAEAMQDDVYQIAQEGWQAVLDGKPNADLIPSALLVARYFAARPPPSRRWRPRVTPSRAGWRNWPRSTAARTGCWPTPGPTKAS